MACGATLKRSRELDPLMSPDTTIKRRRTAVTPGRNPFLQTIQHQSPNPFADGAAASADLEMQPLVETCNHEPVDGLDVRLQAELRLIRARRGLFGGAGNESPVSSDSESEQRFDGNYDHGNQDQRSGMSKSRGDRPVFTYSQVRMICERLLKEQEMRLREEYDQTLNSRLAEQHETFVRFTYDQIHRRLGDAPMSCKCLQVSKGGWSVVLLNDLS